MRRAVLLSVALGLMCLAVGGGTGAAEPVETPKALRERVLKATTSVDKAKAYRELFEKVGRAGMADLMKDEDDGIALQAAWEFHKKVVKRPMGGVDDSYDVDGLKKFVSFVKERTKAPVPAWWAKAILEVSLFRGLHHAFIPSDENTGPKLRESKAGVMVPDRDGLELEGDTAVYTTGTRTINFPKTEFGRTLDEAMSGLVGDKRSILISYSTVSSIRAKIAGFKDKGGKPSWKAEVWGTFNVLGGNLHRWVELIAKDDSIFVFGAETYGMYVESFDIATGKCNFRFSTCYWGDYSETWDLK